MAVAIKDIFLAIVLVTVFLPPDGVDGLKCYACDTASWTNCKEPNSKTNVVTCPNGQGCTRTSTKHNGVFVAAIRRCFGLGLGGLRLGQCLTKRKENTEVLLCSCDSDCCNSGIGRSIGGGECGGGDGGGGAGGGDGGAGYLHGAPFFATVVSNLKRQRMN